MSPLSLPAQTTTSAHFLGDVHVVATSCPPDSAAPWRAVHQVHVVNHACRRAVAMRRLAVPVPLPFPRSLSLVLALSLPIPAALDMLADDLRLDCELHAQRVRGFQHLG